MAHLFTLSEAESLLPTVEQVLRRAMELNRTYQSAQEEFGSTVRKLGMLGGAIPDSVRLGTLRTSGERALAGLRKALSELEDYGVQLKDLDIGLIDFMTRYRGQDVCLCWKLGEDGIHFWHGESEGFRGRKPIDAEFIAGHRGES